MHCPERERLESALAEILDRRDYLSKRTMVSGPAQKVDGKPPSRAREATTEFSAASASTRSER